MVTIHISREICATLDVVWNTVSDLDKEPTFWREIKSVHHVRQMNHNIIEREVVISYRNSKFKETIALNPNYSIEVKITEGPLKGTKIIKLNSLQQCKTRIEIIWNVKFEGILKIFTIIAKRHIAQQTNDALERISKAIEW